jgi:hypothetical protein
MLSVHQEMDRELRRTGSPALSGVRLSLNIAASIHKVPERLGFLQ